jgi:hypothetical protein
VARVGLLPGAVDDTGNLAAAPEQRAVARAVAVLPRIELYEVGAVVRHLADVHRDREHRVRDRQHRRRPARRLAGEHEPRQVGSGLGGGGHVLLARQAADLHERPGEQLLQLRRRVGGPHQRRADQHRVRAGQLRLAAVGAGGDRALRDDDPAARRGLDELELRTPVDGEGGEVARVDPDYGRVELDRPLQLLGVVRLDERVELELAGGRHQLLHPRVVEIAQQQQHRIGAEVSQLLQLGALGEKPLCEQGHAAGRARGSEISGAPSEALIDQDRDGRRARALERRSQRCGIRVGTQLARGGRAALDLGDRLQAVLGKRVAEAPHQALSSAACENSASASSRASAAPESTASRAISSPSRRSAA